MPKAKSNLDRVLDIFENADIKEAQTLLDLAARTVRKKKGVEAQAAPKRTRKPTRTAAQPEDHGAVRDQFQTA